MIRYLVTISLLRFIDVDDMDRGIGKSAERGPEKRGMETDSLDLADPKPVEEERHVPFLTLKVHPDVTVRRIDRKRHLVVERELVQILAEVGKEVLDDPEESQHLDSRRDLFVHLPDERIPRRFVQARATARQDPEVVLLFAMQKDVIVVDA